MCVCVCVCVCVFARLLEARYFKFQTMHSLQRYPSDDWVTLLNVM